MSFLSNFDSPSLDLHLINTFNLCSWISFCEVVNCSLQLLRNSRVIASLKHIKRHVVGRSLMLVVLVLI